MRALSMISSVVFGLSLSACGVMQNLAPETRLSDQVYQLNDEARWGRVDLAASRCTPAYRPVFMAIHRGWGRNVHIGDVDVTNLALGMNDGTAANSLVTYSWIDESTMELHSTTVRQTWMSEGEGFRLHREEVIEGERQLYSNLDEAVMPDLPSDVHHGPRARDSQGRAID